MRAAVRLASLSCSCRFTALGPSTISSCSALSRFATRSTLLTARNFPFRQQSALLHVSSVNSEDDSRKQRRWPFHMTMTEEQKEKKQQNIDAAKLEEAPPGLVGKVKFYLKRYWYIAVPAHMLSCSLWAAALYVLVQSGVDVPSLLETLYMPEWIIEKVKSTPPSAGVVVVALILYKIATPLRYITTLGFIQAIFWGLRRIGKLRTAREVEYRVRTDYETMKGRLGRRVRRYNGQGVRAYTARKKSEGNIDTKGMKQHQQTKDQHHPQSPKKTHKKDNDMKKD